MNVDSVKPPVIIIEPTDVSAPLPGGAAIRMLFDGLITGRHALFGGHRRTN